MMAFRDAADSVPFNPPLLLMGPSHVTHCSHIQTIILSSDYSVIKVTVN